MSYDFTPLSDEELDALAQDGIYEFEVTKSINKPSAKGNPMATITLKIYDAKGTQFTVMDFLVFSSVPLNMKKVKHFCDTTGNLEAYMKGCVPEDLFGFSGKCLIGTREEMPSPSGGFYPRQNIVVDYIKKSAQSSQPKAAPKAAVEEFKDDDIPF